MKKSRRGCAILKCLHLHLSGPLISAVTVKSSGDNGLSAGAVVGTVAGCCVVVGLILAFLWMKCFVGGKDRIDKVQAGGRLVLSYDLDLVYNTNQSCASCYKRGSTESSAFCISC